MLGRDASAAATRIPPGTRSSSPGTRRTEEPREQEGRRQTQDRPCPRRVVKPTHYLLKDVITEYLAATKALKRSWKDDARHGKVWAARLPGRTLDEITAGELERIRTERLRVTTTEDGTEHGVTAATVNREFAFLRRVFNVAIRDDKAGSNPVSKLKTLREPSGRTRYLTDEEEERLMKAPRVRRTASG